VLRVGAVLVLDEGDDLGLDGLQEFRGVAGVLDGAAELGERYGGELPAADGAVVEVLAGVADADGDELWHGLVVHERALHRGDLGEVPVGVGHEDDRVSPVGIRGVAVG
jgi:hypothetical protein